MSENNKIDTLVFNVGAVRDLRDLHGINSVEESLKVFCEQVYRELGMNVTCSVEVTKK